MIEIIVWDKNNANNSVIIAIIAIINAENQPGGRWDLMPLITAKSGREMRASWARMTFSLFCLTSLQGFCSSFTLIDLKASISPSYPQTEVILMCKEPFWMIRYMNMSCSAHWYVKLWMQPDTFGFIKYFRYYINYINYVYYLFKMRKIDNVKSICQVIWLSVL